MDTVKIRVDQWQNNMPKNLRVSGTIELGGSLTRAAHPENKIAEENRKGV